MPLCPHGSRGARVWSCLYRIKVYSRDREVTNRTARMAWRGVRSVRSALRAYSTIFTVAFGAHTPHALLVPQITAVGGWWGQWLAIYTPAVRPQ
jgi:hypothetical protein